MDGLDTIQGRNIHTQQTSFIRVDFDAAETTFPINVNAQLPHNALVLRAGMYVKTAFSAGDTAPEVRVMAGSDVLATGTATGTGTKAMTVTDTLAVPNVDTWVSVDVQNLTGNQGAAIVYIEFIAPR